MYNERKGIESLGRQSDGGIVLWILLVSIGAGAISGVVARYVSEVIIFVPLGLAAIGLVPNWFWNSVGESGFFLLSLVVITLVGGVIGMLVGECIRLLLCWPIKRIRKKSMYRYVLVATPLWPIIALWGYFRHGDIVFLGEPRVLQSFMLWPLGGMIVGTIVAAVLLLRHTDGWRRA